MQGFESTWGILEKIKYANSINSNELIRLISKEESIYSQNSIRTAHRDLYTLEHIDDKKIFDLIGIRLKERQDSLIKQLAIILPGNPTKYFRNYLVFCEECISSGHHHSLFHQFLIFNECPYHERGLIHLCKNCNRKIPYTLTNDYSFQCCCGFSLITGVSVANFNKWNKYRNPEIIHEKIINWLILNKKNENSNILFD
ncbi:hypothetical protein V7127_25760, partial [Bacillus sp. JJ1773]|uniref:hypothetical protein n=1 Tax=Bacillus sp. JJ1773 TaxID=3122965 RepID=UPI002FFF8735